MKEAVFTQLIEDFKSLDEVDAIVLGGSRATGRNDADSDYDIYMYVSQPLPVAVREEILQNHCTYLEVNNAFWETEDDCQLSNGIYIEIIYRSIADMENHLQHVLENYNASCGYSTCLCHSFFHAKILHDPKGLYKDLLHRFDIPFPEQLQKAIIEKNRKLLDGYIPSYKSQIEKALKRNDLVSIQHRITEFLASYFDILFAYNAVYHPGEKNLIKIGQEICHSLPRHFASDLARTTHWKEPDDILPAVDSLILHMDEMLQQS